MKEDNRHLINNVLDYLSTKFLSEEQILILNDFILNKNLYSKNFNCEKLFHRIVNDYNEILNKSILTIKSLHVENINLNEKIFSLSQNIQQQTSNYDYKGIREPENDLFERYLNTIELDSLNNNLNLPTKTHQNYFNHQNETSGKLDQANSPLRIDNFKNSSLRKNEEDKKENSRQFYDKMKITNNILKLINEDISLTEKIFESCGEKDKKTFLQNLINYVYDHSRLIFIYDKIKNYIILNQQAINKNFEKKYTEKSEMNVKINKKNKIGVSKSFSSNHESMDNFETFEKGLRAYKYSDSKDRKPFIRFTKAHGRFHDKKNFT